MAKFHKQGPSFLIILLVLFTIQYFQTAHADRTLFYDDFTGTAAQANNWNYNGNVGGTPQLTGLILQQGQGTMSIGVLKGTSFPNSIRVIANITDPIIGNTTADGQTVYITYRLQPDNYTGITTSGGYELDFGIRNCIQDNCPGGQNSAQNSIGWKIAQCKGCLPGLPFGQLMPPPNQGQWFTINKPMNNAKYCFDSKVSIFQPQNSCNSTGPGNVTNSAIPYGSPQVPFNLEKPHLFQMAMRFYPVSHTSWIAFTIDNLAWQNITQQACQCIDQTTTGGTYAAMYPFIQFSSGTAVSTASFIDYVIVTDYPQVSFPTGQLIGVGAANPTSALHQPMSFDNLFQAEAYSIGGGNPAFGGNMIVLMMILMIILPTAVIWFRLNGAPPPGFIMTIETLAILFLGLLVGILPIWEGVSAVIFAAAISFGLIKSRIQMG